MKPSASNPVPSDGANEFSAYLKYNEILRSWFVAFGVGGPALFLVNDKIGTRLGESGQLFPVLLAFFIGTGSQVIGAVINKTFNWYVYRAASNAAYRERFKHWTLFCNRVLDRCFARCGDRCGIWLLRVSPPHHLRRRPRQPRRARRCLRFEPRR